MNENVAKENCKIIAAEDLAVEVTLIEEVN